MADNEFDVSAGDGPAVPMAPQPPTGAPDNSSSRYNSRINRARNSNRALGRSTSSASLTAEDSLGDGDETTGNPGAAIAPLSGAMGGYQLRKKPLPWRFGV